MIGRNESTVLSFQSCSAPDCSFQSVISAEPGRMVQSARRRGQDRARAVLGELRLRRLGLLSLLRAQVRGTVNAFRSTAEALARSRSGERGFSCILIDIDGRCLATRFRQRSCNASANRSRRHPSSSFQTGTIVPRFWRLPPRPDRFHPRQR